MFSREVAHVYRSLQQSFSFCSDKALRKLLVLRPYSSVSIGTHFEKSAVFALTRLSFDLSVCGGPKDRGVDFRGGWCLRDSCVPVVGQCRKYKKRLGPRHVREMEGVLGRESDATLGILVSAQGYTKDAYDACMGSPHCFALTVLRGTIDNDLGGMDGSAVERADTVNGYAIEELATTDGPMTLNRDCFSVPAECARGTQEPVHQSQELRGIHDDSENFVEYVQENMMCQTHSGSKIAFNDPSSNTVKSAVRTLTSSEAEQDNYCLTDPMVDDMIRSTDSHNWNKSIIMCGQISLFELNPAARKLLPHVFIGTTYKGKHTRNPEIMLVEGDSILHVKTK